MIDSLCRTLLFVGGDPTVGGGFCSVIMRTFIGGYLANGAEPCASSSSVIPRDLQPRTGGMSSRCGSYKQKTFGARQMSASGPYPPDCSITSGAILRQEGPHLAALMLATAVLRGVPHQHGVPTNVAWALEPNEPHQDAATPKSASFTFPMLQKPKARS